MFKAINIILPVLLGLMLLASGCQPPSEPPEVTSVPESSEETSVPESPESFEEPVSSEPEEPEVELHPEGTEVGNLAPDFQLEDLEGQDVSLSGFRGKPVLVNFWATWCPPCRYEMPFLEKIYQEWSDRGLVLLTINVAESRSRAQSFIDEYGLSMPVLLDERKEVTRKYNVRGIPTTFFIDKNGIIQQKVVGTFPDTKAIEEQLGSIIP